MIHPRGRRSDPAPGEHRLGVFLFSLEDHLDAIVRVFRTQPVTPSERPASGNGRDNVFSSRLDSRQCEKRRLVKDGDAVLPRLIHFGARRIPRDDVIGRFGDELPVTFRPGTRQVAFASPRLIRRRVPVKTKDFPARGAAGPADLPGGRPARVSFSMTRRLVGSRKKPAILVATSGRYPGCLELLGAAADRAARVP